MVFRAAHLIASVILLGLIGCNQHDVRSFQGYVEGENIYLAAPYQGKLVQKLVSRGQRVKQGDLLFVLDPYPEQLTVQQNQAIVQENISTLSDLQKPKRPPEIDAILDQIEQAEANLTLAALRVKRFEQLYQHHAIELDRVDEIKSTQRADYGLKAQYQANLALARLGARDDQLAAQEAKVAEAKAQLSLAEWQLAQKKIVAPADGIIFDTYYQQGEYVAAARPVATLLPDSQIRIEFFVPVTMLARIHLRKPIQFICDGCQQASDADITYISSEAEFVPPLVYSRENEDNLVFRIKAMIRRGTNFKPGQPVRVLIESDHVA